MTLDRRTTAFRRDLAAETLRGLVDAPRFAVGEPFVVLDGVVDLKREPRPDAALETQLLHGETLRVYDEEDGWGWAQADRDGYVGYVAMSALWRDQIEATHRVAAGRTFVYPSPDMKQPVLMGLPMDARLHVCDVVGDFVKLRPYGFAFAAHVAPLDERAADRAGIAELFENVPYLWGGKTTLGIDCSGLVQVSASMAGLSLPRDTDMQETTGARVEVESSLGGLRRGDLVFWRGHVGLMLDAEALLHANAHHMLVAREPLVHAKDRIYAKSGSTITSIRRL